VFREDENETTTLKPLDVVAHACEPTQEVEIGRIKVDKGQSWPINK
jgi:hypothetical protein